VLLRSGEKLLRGLDHKTVLQLRSKNSSYSLSSNNDLGLQAGRPPL